MSLAASFLPLPWYTFEMADFQREVTPAIEATPPPAPSHSNLASFSFRAEGFRLTQSGGRLIVVNYFGHRILIGMKCMILLSSLFMKSSPPFTKSLPSLSYWTNLFHHATWQTMLSAVLAANWQPDVGELCLLSLLAMFYWFLVVVGDFSGVVLDQRNSTAKAAGRTSPLTKVEAVRVIALGITGKPGPGGRRYSVRLLWSDAQSLSDWRKLLLGTEAKSSFLGVFRHETDAGKFANAVAEFAGLPVRHEIWKK